ncbi:hypothetical protein [Salinisphaera sp.]|uniref:hypothetical protein n=1 Tax=Salinisphaera sp. TaxID=1914330 RepID=UPI000C3DE699|nr:hypothetical protein [Salinisphaera sp.]MBS63157.1 hypothetical protein [Salinisphaera sp.]
MTRLHQAIDAARQILGDHEAGVPQRVPYSGGTRALVSNAKVGSIAGRAVTFDDTDIRIIRRWLDGQTHDASGAIEMVPGGTRTQTARHLVREKIGASPVARSSGLVAVAAAGDGTARLNGEGVSRGGGRFHVLRNEVPCELDADWLLLVENYEPFLALTLDDAELGGARSGRGLLVLRSAPAFPYGQVWATRMRPEFQVKLRHAPDFDPAGLSDLISMQADHAWLPDLAALGRSEITPSRDLMLRQMRQFHGLHARAQSTCPALLEYIDWLGQAGGGVSQESLMAARVTMRMVDLTQVTVYG